MYVLLIGNILLEQMIDCVTSCSCNSFFKKKTVCSKDWNKAFNESSGVQHKLVVWQNISILNYTFKQQLGEPGNQENRVILLLCPCYK